MGRVRGWRLSLAGAALPALLLFLGSLALPDTPNSLLERGHEEAAHRVLARVRTEGQAFLFQRQCTRAAPKSTLKAMAHHVVAWSGTACCKKHWRLGKRAATACSAATHSVHLSC